MVLMVEMEKDLYDSALTWLITQEDFSSFVAMKASNIRLRKSRNYLLS
jgi:hypothetical protein